MAFLASLLGITLAMPGCTRTPKASSVPITEVQKISFSQQGMARAAITNRIIRRTDQGAEIVLELWDGEEPDSVYPTDASVLQEARELLETYDVGSWNGFKGSNRAVLDGESFGFYVEFTDGSTISAYGTNSFPPHYREVYSALWDLTAPAQERRPASNGCSSRVWVFPTSILQRKISRCIYVCTACGYYEASQTALQF